MTSSQSSEKSRSIPVSQLRELANIYWRLEKFALTLGEDEAQVIKPQLARFSNILEFNSVQIKSDYYEESIELPKVLCDGEVIQEAVKE